MDKIVLDVFFAGVRDDSYKDKKTGQDVAKFLADLYLPGTGSFSIPVETAVYAGLLSTPPMSARFRLPIKLEVIQRVMKSEGGASYARSEMVVRYGNLERIDEQKKAS